jgi:putative addiction module antidote
MIKLKLTKVGESLGVILPDKVLRRLRIHEGDSVLLSELPNGYQLLSHDREFEEQMTLARKIMRERRDLLRELAK